MKMATLAATVTSHPSLDGSELIGLSSEVGWLELRADLAGDVPASWFRQRFSAQTMYSLRSSSAGGHFDGPNPQRERRLISAAAEYDFVELEGPRDLSPNILNRIPPSQRIVSWHGAAANKSVLQRRFGELAATPARYYRLTCPSEHVQQATVPLLFLKQLGRSDVIAYATGAAGVWTSVMAPSWGWPIVFGTVSDHADVQHGLPVARLIDDFGLPRIRTYRQLYGIIGDPISHSLSPRIHNAAYRAADQPAIFVPLLVNDFVRFWQSFIAAEPFAELDLAVRGMTVASPHKETSSQAAAHKSKIVDAARSSNLVYRHNGTWRTETTDPDGVLLNLLSHSIPLAGSRVAIIGCGGSGRAIAAALKQAGSRVTLFNRNLERGQRAMRLLSVPFVPLAEFRADAFSVVVNATPVGRDGQLSPFELNRLRDGTVVIDHVYGTQVTPLTEFARARGLTTIDGRDILCTQVARQFQLMTGQQMPPGLAQELTHPSHLNDTQPTSSDGQNTVSTTAQDQPCLPER